MKTDYKTVKVEVKDDVAILALNNPPVNQLSEHFVREMADALIQAASDKAIKAVILTGTGKNFIAGADITEIQKVKDKNFLLPRVMENHRFINSIEDAPKPVIAAINGHCLGGGLEIAMACHYRIAGQGVQIGQPEVKIGLIPGAGGTQRLPRLIGFVDALQMITMGNPIPAEEGLKKGAIDEVVPANQLLDQALHSRPPFYLRRTESQGLPDSGIKRIRCRSPKRRREFSLLPKEWLPKRPKDILPLSRPLRPWSGDSRIISKPT